MDRQQEEKREHLSRRYVQSVAFGRWLKLARKKAGLSQVEAAKNIGVDQQSWSKMERLGKVPQGKFLEQICALLQASVTEVLGIINSSLDFNSRVQEYAQRYDAYKAYFIQREKTAGPVGIFILREDPEPVDIVAVREYSEILKATEHTRINILFRYSHPKSWSSFYRLVGALAQQLGHESVNVLPRLRGFYRNPEFAEQVEASLPIIHPYILGVDNRGVDLTLAIFDQSVKQEEMAKGCDESEATQRSLSILPQDRHAATQLSQWIGLSSATEPLSQMWVPVVAPV